MGNQNGSQSFQPGWYPDPVGRHQYRYWDGSAWKDDVADGGQASTDPLSPGLASWTPQISGTCDGCQAPTASGKRIIFYTGTLTAVSGGGWSTTNETYSPGERSSVLLCPACHKGVKPNQVISRKMSGDGLAGSHFWLEGPFVSNFGNQFFGAGDPRDPYYDPHYVRIRDIVRDRLVTAESIDDATVLIYWKGVYVAGDPVLTVELDEVSVGLGAFRKDFVASVKVPAGVHKVSVGPPHPTPSRADQIVDFERAAVYHMEVHFRRASGRYSSQIQRMG